YEFGYGLSYTTYNYSNLVLSAKEFGEKFTASVTVKNSGKVAGREVVQLYLTAPSGKLVKPAQTLAAFAKTKLLRAGESQIVTFQLEPRDLASFDEEKSGWVADAGNYVVKVGASSANLPLTATFSLPASLSCGTVNRALAPTAPFAKMTDK
ncbi:MAG: fibronectin type III-like domain-contianing protein, partial [Marinilabiliales bacterium]|nr:fibronectin type III-like domain-contianing protein [Marinilabiliales bacterium]